MGYDYMALVENGRIVSVEAIKAYVEWFPFTTPTV
jgi:hypothetical protein